MNLASYFPAQRRNERKKKKHFPSPCTYADAYFTSVMFILQVITGVTKAQKEPRQLIVILFCSDVTLSLRMRMLQYEHPCAWSYVNACAHPKSVNQDFNCRCRSKIRIGLVW